MKLVGQTFQGRNGHYEVTSVSPDLSEHGTGKGTITVKYLDGEWKDKVVTMRYRTHFDMQNNLRIKGKIGEEQKKQGLEESLDQWWYKHPHYYKLHWHKNITGEELLARLEAEHPEEEAELWT